MKLNLNVEERVSIAQFLPKEGSLSEQIIGKSVLDKTMISKDERKELRYDPLYQGRIDPATDFTKEIELSNEEFELLYSDFLQKDKEKKINVINVDLALKIREAKNQKPETVKK
jgi:hypothetical protein